jgi:hypothetical protein
VCIGPGTPAQAFGLLPLLPPPAQPKPFLRPPSPKHPPPPGFSAQSLFFSVYIATFNAVWAALPTIAFGIFDQVLDRVFDRRPRPRALPPAPSPTPARRFFAVPPLTLPFAAADPARPPPPKQDVSCAAAMAHPQLYSETRTQTHRWGGEMDGGAPGTHACLAPTGPAPAARASSQPPSAPRAARAPRAISATLDRPPPHPAAAAAPSCAAGCFGSRSACGTACARSSSPFTPWCRSHARGRRRASTCWAAR